MMPQDEEGPSKKRYLDFLDILLTARDDTGKGLTPEEIRNEVDTFLFEGKTLLSGINYIQQLLEIVVNDMYFVCMNCGNPCIIGVHFTPSVSFTMRFVTVFAM